ncbi:MAG TPA: class I adenylate-forming enzyme family protein [Acidimicrobiales bacterium]|nr:class I adenylate-forming enzyme family protein [Acidimicrobiales bacterium]
MTTFEGPPVALARGIGARTLGGFLLEVVDRFGSNEALVFDDPLLGGRTARWTYEQLGRQSWRVAGALMAAGVRPGVRVGILMGNRPEAVIAFFGATLAGATAVLMSTFSAPAELEYLIDHSGTQVLLTQSKLLGRTLPKEIESLETPSLETVAAVGEGWEEFLAGGTTIGDGELRARANGVRPEDPGSIVYSSGTTDRPKGILHANGAPSLQFWIQAQVFGRHPRTRMWTALPMFWTAGLNTGMGATLAAGGCWVMQETFQPEEALRLIERERVTEPYTLPHQTAALVELPEWETADLSSLKNVFGKSAFARHSSVKGDPAWNSPVGYGLSETCSIFATHYSDDPRELLKHSTGRLLPGNRLRVIDPGSGRLLGPGEAGELAVAGPTLMEHYVGKTPDECFDDEGFFHTGDAGWFDEAGFLHWTGRRSEMIKTAGANVSPAEIEVALRAFRPAKLARVIGRPDPRLGEIVVLCLVLRDGEHATADDVRSFLRERLAAYKVPTEILFLSDGEVPMTSSDTKVRDDELRRIIDARLDTSRALQTPENSHR